MVKIGMTLTQTKVVQADETAKIVGSGGLDVFSTPCLLAFMEHTAYNLVQSEMNSGETTVGIEANLKHLHANLVGETVSCTAIVKNIEGKKIFFEIVVLRDDDLMASCNHIRYIINEKKFLEKLKGN